VSALGTKLRKIEGGKVGYWCPGCDMMHVLTVERGTVGPCWDWNGDADLPTFSPSILVNYHHWVPPVTPANLADWQRKPWPQEKRHHVCHAFVREGRVEFLGDCTHALAGQTVPLPDFGVVQ
jgi:hypothetical protein